LDLQQVFLVDEFVEQTELIRLQFAEIIEHLVAVELHIDLRIEWSVVGHDRFVLFDALLLDLVGFVLLGPLRNDLLKNVVDVVLLRVFVEQGIGDQYDVCTEVEQWVLDDNKLVLTIFVDIHGQFILFQIQVNHHFHYFVENTFANVFVYSQ